MSEGMNDKIGEADREKIRRLVREAYQIAGQLKKEAQTDKGGPWIGLYPETGINPEKIVVESIGRARSLMMRVENRKAQWLAVKSKSGKGLNPLE